ncbi:uncharacterized protein LOC6644494 [Drosophila willistoni]|uniref:uncharacterized protein LOC6644494 n=1 Tax=Drosophila willistoni TaxID=7260 RepID=UPI001F07D83D|nr:uncharacterized protein LOC6644494 [Drosophila willistoni]
MDAYMKNNTGGPEDATSASSSTSTTTTSANVKDLKTDIPYFDDSSLSRPSEASKQKVMGRRQDDGDDGEGFDPSLLFPPQSKTECDIDEYTPAGWAEVDADNQDADENYAEDNGSAMGSEYAASGSAANSYYQSPTPSNSDLMLRPPSNTNFHYNYPSPGSASSAMSAAGAGAGDSNGLPMPLQMQQLAGPTGGGGGGAAGMSRHGPFTHSQGQLGPPAPAFYPNMWYPNAPYGTGGGGGSSSSSGPSGGPYGRYYGPGQGGAGAGGPFGAPHLHPHALHPHHPQHHPHHPQHHPSAHHLHHHGPPPPPTALHSHHSHPHGHHPHHTHPHPHGHHPHETMMEMFQLSNSGREARNRAEKNRRDKLNGSIQELSTMVPHVAESPRRVDKTAVLRFAAHGLRLKYAFGKTLHQPRPQITDTLMTMLDSFFLTLTCHGQILLISSSIEQHLGHCQTDLYGQSIMQITHPEDQNMLKQQLIPTELENLFDAHTDSDADGEPRQRSKTEEDYIDRKLREDKRSFRVRLARAGPRSEPTAYEVVKIDGCFRRSDEAPRGVRSNTFSSSLQLIRRTRGRDDAIPLHTISGNDIVLTACARIIRPPKIISRLVDANTLEYKTRHLIDGRIIDCDQRIGIVAGYMTDEVRNLSPFTFMHNDDVRWVIVALRQMYDCNSSYGESTYRLFTRNGNIIYLQSKGYLEIDKETNKVHSFVCVNTLLDEEEGKRRVQEMKKKFSVIIKTQIPTQSAIDVPASEHPAQLEKAVLRLIQNQHHGSSSSSMSQARLNATHHSMSSSKTPPLALVPPETASVKSSIFNSVNVVNITAAKHLRGIHSNSVKSPNSSEPIPQTPVARVGASSGGCTCSTSTASGTDKDCDYCQNPLTPDTIPAPSLKRSSTAAALTAPEDDDDDDDDDGGNSVVKMNKRLFIESTEIEHVLNTSLVHIGRKLHQQLNVARNLRDQGNRYELPLATQRIDEIMEEHQKQSELYVNIKSEYEVQLQNKANNSSLRSEHDPHGNGSGMGGGQLAPR